MSHHPERAMDRIHSPFRFDLSFNKEEFHGLVDNGALKEKDLRPQIIITWPAGFPKIWRISSLRDRLVHEVHFQGFDFQGGKEHRGPRSSGRPPFYRFTGESRAEATRRNIPGSCVSRCTVVAQATCTRRFLLRLSFSLRNQSHDETVTLKILRPSPPSGACPPLR